MNADNESPLSPSEMLQLAERQQEDVARRKAHDVPWIVGAWAVTWTVGFLAFWLEGIDALPQPVAPILFGVLWLAAIVVSIVLSVRTGRGIRQSSAASFTGTVYGLAWPLVIVAMIVFWLGLSQNGMPPQLSGLFLPVAMAIAVGLLYLVGGGIWRSGIMVGTGLVVIAGALVAPFLGQPTHFLVLAIAGLVAFGGSTVATARWAQPVGMWV